MLYYCLVRLKQHLCSANIEDQEETKCTGVGDSLYEWSLCTDQGYVKHLSVVSIFFVLFYFSTFSSQIPSKNLTEFDWRKSNISESSQLLSTIKVSNESLSLRFLIVRK